jgi:hypothetical protein
MIDNMKVNNMMFVTAEVRNMTVIILDVNGETHAAPRRWQRNLSTRCRRGPLTF